jgi:hypothetical protein
MNKIDLIVCEKKENEGLPSCVYLTCFKPEQTSGHSNSTGVKYIQATTWAHATSVVQSFGYLWYIISQCRVKKDGRQ